MPSHGFGAVNGKGGLTSGDRSVLSLRQGAGAVAPFAPWQQHQQHQQQQQHQHQQQPHTVQHLPNGNGAPWDSSPQQQQHYQHQQVQQQPAQQQQLQLARNHPSQQPQQPPPYQQQQQKPQHSWQQTQPVQQPVQQQQLQPPSWVAQPLPDGHQWTAPLDPNTTHAIPPSAAGEPYPQSAPPPPPPPPQLLSAPPPDVLVVETAAQARAVVDQLLRLAEDGVRNPATGAVEQAYFACDTEVAGIDVKEESPVGHGVVTCFSVYAGPWLDFGGGGGGVAGAAVAKPRIWVDLLKGWERRARARQQSERSVADEEGRIAERLRAEEEATQRAAAAELRAAEEARKAQEAEAKAAARARAREEAAAAKAAAKAEAKAKAAADAAAEAKPAPKRVRKTRASAAQAAEGPTVEASAEPAAAPSHVPEPAAPGDAPAAAAPKAARKRRTKADIQAAAQQAGADAAAAAEEAAAPAPKRRATRKSKKALEAAAEAQQDAVEAAVAAPAEPPDVSAAPAAAPKRRGRKPKSSYVAAAAEDAGAGRGGGIVAAFSLDSDWAVSVGSNGGCGNGVAWGASGGPHSEAAQEAVSDCASGVGGASAAGSSAAWGPLYLDEGEPELPPPTLQEVLEDKEAAGILREFARFFGDERAKKVWHNYGFDRHVLSNMGVHCKGFGGDTLHMARLHDASRKLQGGYSLEGLSSDRKLLEVLEADLQAEALLPKRGMKDRFARPKRKGDGSPTKARFMPPMHVLHTSEATRYEWVDYSALDAKATWNVHRALKAHLEAHYAYMDDYLAHKLSLGPEPRPKAALPPPQQQQQQQPAPARGPRRRVPAGPGAAQLARPGGGNGGLNGGRNGGHVVGAMSVVAAAAAAEPARAPAQGAAGSSALTQMDVYRQYWLPFGELLTDMEQAGVRVNREHLRTQEAQAKLDQAAAEAYFRDWAQAKVPAAKYMNISSGLQIRQLLFPDAVEDGSGVRVFKAENPDHERGIAEGWKPKPLRFVDMPLHGIWGQGVPGRLQVEVTTEKGSPAVSTAVLRSLAGKPGAAFKALQELDGTAAAAAAASRDLIPIVDTFDDEGADEFGGFGDDAAAAADGNGGGGAAKQRRASRRSQTAAAGGGQQQQGQQQQQQQQQQWQAEDCRSQEELAAEAASKGWGKMYAAMGGGREGLWACAAIEKLCEVSAIDKLLSAFIVPLQGDDISTPDAERGGHRVHCSLNLNTETGRLSARRPNLQNQPALEKDRYKVRKAFCASEGNTLIVADYGQLELRLLAHMANCQSMLRAFELGGDFHSRTALGMYDHIKAAIDKGECLLEWDGGPDHAPCPVPLLKDKFASERRKAKVLNFSIAYGKTAHGLSKDWGVSLKEAEETLKRWYADRPEVLQWQEETRAYARAHGYVNTMLGRRRNLPSISSPRAFERSRAERAAINTPIQGSAADVATAAMLAIQRDEWLRENGWRLLLQVHDEVMLEGPKESAAEARQRVIAAMENPWANLGHSFEGRPLRVELVVDCKAADTWYDAK